MCDMIRSSCTSAANALSSAVVACTNAGKSVVGKISGSYGCLSRKIDTIADSYLPEKVAYVAKKALHSLPITLGIMYAPMTVVIPALAAYVICGFIHPQPFKQETVGDVNTGIGNAFVVGALQESAAIFKKTQASILPLVVNLLFAMFLHNRATKAYSKADAADSAATGDSSLSTAATKPVTTTTGDSSLSTAAVTETAADVNQDNNQ